MTDNQKKRIRPAYCLKTIKKAFNKAEKLKMTSSAMQGQWEMGFSDTDVVNAIQALVNENFYKSMVPIKPGFTSWQDVYKSQYYGVDLYIKFQIDQRGEVIVSFKARYENV